MTTWDTLKLDRLTTTPLTVTTDGKENKKRRPTLRRFFVFCQHTVSTFAKPHEPVHSPSFAKELTLSVPQIIAYFDSTISKNI